MDKRSSQNNPSFDKTAVNTATKAQGANANQQFNRLNWLAFGLRWLLFLGCVFLLTAPAPRTGSNSLAFLPVVVGIGSLYNLLVAVFLTINFSGRPFQFLTVGLDTILAILLFWASGDNSLILVGAGLIPIVVAGIRLGLWRGVGVALTLGAAGIIIAAVTGQFETAFTSLIPTFLFLLIAAGLIGAVHPVENPVMADGVAEIESRLTEAAHERAKAVYEMATTLGATLDYNKVLDAALEMGSLGLKEMGSEDRLIGMVMLFEGDELKVVSSQRLTRQDTTKRVPGKDGIFAQALKQAEPIFGNTPNNDPELKYFAAYQEAKSILVIPLRAGYSNYGLIVFGAYQQDAFSADHIELLTAIGTQATIALQNASLYQNLVEEKERIVDIEEDARKKLARDLHDGPTQSIAAIAMRVNYIRRLMENRPVEALEELVKVEDLARKTTKEIRHMLFTLRPLVLETQGLTPALEQFAEKVKDTHDLNVTVQSQQGTDELLESHAQGVLFYLVEEAVGNARKHAQAEHIYVRLYRRDQFVTVEIQDDGVGFDVDAVNTNYDKRGSLGMVNMRERAALVDGTLKVESAKGKGTKISVLIPVKRDLNQDALGNNNNSNNNNSQKPAQIGSNPTRL